MVKIYKTLFWSVLFVLFGVLLVFSYVWWKMRYFENLINTVNRDIEERNNLVDSFVNILIKMKKETYQ
jgi:hypothetical protein